ncbi:hypothetical protein DYU11_23590 [Fibrisoma montanum]|uniref:Uncharacterized protein n=1 Tax=Fibrisoma montanum TaxID=2305895 RepID=A0A418M2J8_9BACT|nr:hypothetical protein [Fibrisoma montanum]RIV19904.1 hypothetical protein DYU11_23590 [Fibrisoma montanum]
MDKETLLALLTNYQNGQATDEERALVEAWYNALDPPVEPTHPEAEKRALLIKNWHRLEPQTTLETTIRRLPMRFYRGLATVALLAYAIWLGWNLVSHELEKADRRATHPERAKILERMNRSGQKLRLRSSKKSLIVYLNAEVQRIR